MGHVLTVNQKEEVVHNLEGKSKREAEKTLLSLSSQLERHRPDQIKSLTESMSFVSFAVSTETPARGLETR